MERNKELIFSYSRYQCPGKNVASIKLNKIFVDLLRRYNFTAVDPLKSRRSWCARIFLQEENPAIGPSAAIAQLNERRQLTGSMEFKQYREKHHSRKPPPKPSFLTLEIPTLAQLRDGITYVFRPFSSQTAASRHAAANRDDRKREISLWTQGLDRLLDSWMSSEPMASDLKEPARPTADQNEMMVDFLICLNRSVEKSDDRMRRSFYQSAEYAGIHGVLDKLQTVSKSLRVMKEIEEFEDVKQEWKDS